MRAPDRASRVSAATVQVPGKLLSAYAEGAAVVLAGLGLLVHSAVSRDDPTAKAPPLEAGTARRPPA